MTSAKQRRPLARQAVLAARIGATLGIAASAYLVWCLHVAVLLAFAAVLLAMLLRLLARPLDRFTPLAYSLCLALAGMLILALLAWTVFLFGTQAWSEFDTLLSRIQQGSEAIREHLSGSGIGRALLAQFDHAASMMGAMVQEALASGISALEAIVVIGFSAAYLAAQPALYRDGTLLLVPHRHRHQAAETLECVGHAVRLWLVGQLIEMAIIGALTAGATWLIGLPTPLALGLIAGITEFVPYLGPIVAAVPALLAAVSQGPGLVLWTLGSYLAIHLFEGNVLMPLLQRWLVSVPPALMLLGMTAFGLLFGVLGVILAAPMVVALFTAVRKLYVKGTLGKDSQDGEQGRVASADLGSSTHEVPRSRQANRRAMPPVRALTLAHVIVVLLAVIVVGGRVIEWVGGRVPWPHGFELPASLSGLTLVYLFALRHRVSASHAPIRAHPLPGRAGPQAARPSSSKPRDPKSVPELAWLRGVEMAAKRFRAFSWKGGLP
ncbi:AI-2E family transporter [Methylobacterium sp. CM6257]